MTWRDLFKRPVEPFEVELRDGVPVIAFAPADRYGTWDELRTAWLDMPAHPAIIEPVRVEHRSLLLRYPAIATSLESPSARQIASWAMQVALAFDHIIDTVPQARWWVFSQPVGEVDLEGYLRISFFPPGRGRIGTDPHHVVERVWRELADSCPQFPTTSAVLRKHYSDFYDAWTEMNAFTRGEQHLRSAVQQEAWRVAETALGLLRLGRVDRALPLLERANRATSTPAIRAAINQCRAAFGLPPNPEPADEIRAPKYQWPGIRAFLDELEVARDFSGALAIYGDLRVDDGELSLVCTRRARCHLEVGDSGHAIDFAKRAVEAEPARLDARMLLVRALTARKLFAEALGASDELLALATYDAMAHYLRGKALIGLGRLEDARDAFDLAIALRPTLLEALMLRRQVDDNLRKLGKAVGAQRTQVVLPASVEHLREVLASGRSKDIIEALSGLREDVDAQLLLARYLGFAGEHDRALVVYERLIGTRVGFAAMVGKATTLFERGHYEAALAYFDVLVVERRADSEACEGRARTLEKLGRVGEAAAEFRRLVALADAESSLRVKAARLWLDAHLL